MKFNRKKFSNAPLHRSEWDELSASFHNNHKDFLRNYLEGKPVDVLMQLHVDEQKAFETPDGYKTQPGTFGRTVKLYAAFARAHEAALDRKRNLHLAVAALIISLVSVGLSFYIWYVN